MCPAAPRVGRQDLYDCTGDHLLIAGSQTRRQFCNCFSTCAPDDFASCMPHALLHSLSLSLSFSLLFLLFLPLPGTRRASASSGGRHVAFLTGEPHDLHQLRAIENYKFSFEIADSSASWWCGATHSMLQVCSYPSQSRAFA